MKSSMASSIDKTLSDIFKSMEKENVSQQQKDLILAPLVDVLTEKADDKYFRKKYLLLTGLVAAAVALWHIPLTSTFSLVILRGILVKVLPFWNWTPIYYSQCLVENPLYVSKSLTEEDCNVCELVESLEKYEELSMGVVSEDFLQNEVPFVVTDAMVDWPVMTSHNFYFDNITDVFMDEALIGNHPCTMLSSLRMRKLELREFLLKIHDPHVQKWFGFWENCDKSSVKALRTFYERPYFMPPMVEFSDSNWVFISSNIKAKIFKKVDYVTQLLMFVQIRGSSDLRISPKEPCQSACPVMMTSLTEGEILVVTSNLWKLEFLPGPFTDNLAVAVGGFWK